MIRVKNYIGAARPEDFPGLLTFDNSKFIFLLLQIARKSFYFLARTYEIARQQGQSDDLKSSQEIARLHKPRLSETRRRKVFHRSTGFPSESQIIIKPFNSSNEHRKWIVKLIELWKLWLKPIFIVEGIIKLTGPSIHNSLHFIVRFGNEVSPKSEKEFCRSAA